MTTEQTEPETPVKESRMKKFGPAIFWGAIVALPAINLAAAALNYKTVKTSHAIELLKTVNPES